MGRMPDLTPLIYFAMFGIACAALIALIGGSWLAYHLYMAMAMYLGA
ncbi:MAG: hypothetical protein OJJ21_16735 [Ferrovibrio sp.]|nr:hypothetical protein [Ferrovibrio sp.]MCW0235249.1 hypothetical protein [Ferrovibrio sp.]